MQGVGVFFAIRYFRYIRHGYNDMNTRHLLVLSLTCIMLLFAGAISSTYAGLQASSEREDPTDEIAKIQKAIAEGNSAELSRYSGAYIEVNVSGSTTLHSRAQAAYILKAFFRDNPPERFAFQRTMRLGSDWFVSGQYWQRSDNRPYQVEILLRWNGQRYEIKSIRFNQVLR